MAKFSGVWLCDVFVDTTDFDACVDATEIITLLLLLKVELSGEVPNQCRRGTSASSALLQVTLRNLLLLFESFLITWCASMYFGKKI